MGRYTVVTGQNLYDVALHIYGSVEGIIDLMMNNTSLSLADTLRAGDELVYTDDYLINADIVAYNRLHGIVPANGERGVYPKYPPQDKPLELEAVLSGTGTSAGFALAGTADIVVDWGDNTPLQTLPLTGDLHFFHHSFDNVAPGERRIRIYGGGSVTQADLSALQATALYGYPPSVLERFTLNDATLELDFLPVMQKAYHLDLTGIKTPCLLPLTEVRTAMQIDLTGASVPREALDAYLIALAGRYYGRRPCTVTLPGEPSGDYREPPRDENQSYLLRTGMEAMWVLTHEPAWNEAGYWKFIVNSTTYTTQP